MTILEEITVLPNPDWATNRKMILARLMAEVDRDPETFREGGQVVMPKTPWVKELVPEGIIVTPVDAENDLFSWGGIYAVRGHYTLSKDLIDRAQHVLDWFKVRQRIKDRVEQKVSRFPELISGGSLQLPQNEDPFLDRWANSLAQNGLYLGVHTHFTYDPSRDKAWGEYASQTTTFTIYWGDQKHRGINTTSSNKK